MKLNARIFSQIQKADLTAREIADLLKVSLTTVRNTLSSMRRDGMAVQVGKVADGQQKWRAVA